jgi:hypothetical protein
MMGVQRFKLFDVDLAGHVRRRCVAGWLEIMISPLRRMSFRSIEQHKPESSAHIALPRRDNLVEPTLLHRCRVIVHDRY